MGEGGVCAVETSGLWIGPEERPLLAWSTRPVGATGELGVIVLPPIGYEYWTSHRTLRVLAERLAARGALVLRVDHDGTADSAGDQWDEGRVARWRASAQHAARELRANGVSRLVIVGLRFGATLALLDAANVGAGAVVAWAPVVSGRRFVREMRLLATAVPADANAPEREGAVAIAGTIYSAKTIADLACVDLAHLEAPVVAQALVVDRADRPASTPLLNRLRALGCQTDHLVGEGSDLMLDQPTEYATVPTNIVDEIVTWIGPSAGGGLAPGAPRARARFAWGAKQIEEEVVVLGEKRLVGVLGRPRAGSSTSTVIFLNTGSEPHIGPGRAWVEFARHLTVAGYTTLRFDFRGWGESPDDGRAPGRPYAAHAAEDLADVVAALRRDGHTRLVLVGLCAGAWIALRAVLREDLAGVVAINPQMYWQPGHPVEATMAETRARRTREREREEWGARWKVWDALDLFGVRHAAAGWLRRLRKRGTPILMLFAEGDDGIEFLRNRTLRQLRLAQRSEHIDVVELPGIDHPMHRHWLRPLIVAEIERFLAAGRMR